MSTLSDLKTRQLQAANEYNRLINDSNFVSLQQQVKESFAEYNRISRRGDEIFRSGGSVEQIQEASRQTQVAFAKFTQINQQYAPLHKQAIEARTRYDTATAQVAQLAVTQTEPVNNQQQQFQQQTTAAVNQAEQTSSPQPPQQFPNLDEDPLGFESPNQQPSFVFSQRQTNFLESYNRSLVEQGFSPVDPASPEALSVVSRLSTSEEEFELGPPLRVDISGVPRIDDFLESDLQGDTDIDGQVIENFDEEFQSSEIQTFTEQAREQIVGQAAPDWRVRITLAEQADYFYNAANPGILKPLADTNGVIFPYTPQITVNYTATYNPLDIVHSNYKFYSYKNSSVESVMIVGDFTAQNTVEANYMLAVIHFFRSLTKMFYGQDQNPSRGVPPPLCYLKGYGAYQFDNHPMVITNFTYNLPVDVDYITAYPTNPTSAIGGIDLSPYTPTSARSFSPLDRLRSLVSSGIDKGGLPPPPTFNNTQNINEATRVPTKINIQLTCLPIATRNAVSNKFSLKDYANGSLLRGSVNPGTGGGFW